jgi:hypothetical protein
MVIDSYIITNLTLNIYNIQDKWNKFTARNTFYELQPILDITYTSILHV